MKVYLGTVDAPGEWRVDVKNLIEGTITPLPHHVLHSPDGFAWGYAGSAPTELARCLLIDALDVHDPAPRIVNRYRRHVLELLDKDLGFTISQHSILSWVANERSDEE